MLMPRTLSDVAPKNISFAGWHIAGVKKERKERAFYKPE